MGYADAKADGIRMESVKGSSMYSPRCFFCLSEVPTRQYLRSRRYVCRACQPSKKILKQYYEDRESRNLFDAIHRERERERTQKQAGQNP